MNITNLVEFSVMPKQIIFLVCLVAMAVADLNPIDAKEPMTTLTIASTQYPIEGNKSVEEILGKVEAFVQEAAEKKADVIVFPELITLDAWPVPEPQNINEKQIVETVAREVTPGYFEGIRKLAQKYQLAIVAGSSPVLETEAGKGSPKIYNTTLLCFSDGQEFTQRKIHATHWEREIGFSPGEKLSLVETPWGKSAILVCYDVEFPNLSANLISESPVVLFVPSMAESPAGMKRVRWTAQARAIEHHAIVVVSGTVGQTTDTWHHFGQAAVFSPADEEFFPEDTLGEPSKRQLIIQTINLPDLLASRSKSHYYPAKDVRERQE